MIIKKFQGKTEEEAIEEAKKTLGEGTVIMNVKTIKNGGFFKAFKKTVYEVTAAKEEEEQSILSTKVLKPLHNHENINMVANEKIEIPPMKEPEPLKKAKENIQESNGLEEKLENLQTLLEKQLVPGKKNESEEVLGDQSDQPAKDERLVFIKMIYGIMLENGIDEKYANQIIDEVESILRNGSSVDYLLSNIYQKMILKFGQPQVIELSGKKPKVVFFMGPTGVGKTTTVAKIASRFKMEQGKKVALLTADTYRIAATEQLRTYANILNAPLNIIYTAEELNEAVSRVEDYDLVMVDTAGLSHYNEEQRSEIKKLIENVDEKYEKEIYLVLSATTKYKDLLSIVDTYKEDYKFKIIFTKLDETTCYGNIFNLKMYTGADLSYTTYGQNVPDDIEVFNSQKIVKLLLGGK